MQQMSTNIHNEFSLCICCTPNTKNLVISTPRFQYEYHVSLHVLEFAYIHGPHLCH
jgi:hypothetical protein